MYLFLKIPKGGDQTSNQTSEPPVRKQRQKWYINYFFHKFIGMVAGLIDHFIISPLQK